MTAPSVSPPLIRLENLSVTLAGRAILRGISWRLMPGEHWAALGANGAGKSSLLRVLRGELRPDQDGASRCVWAFDGREDSSPLAVRPLAALVSGELQRAYVRQGWRLTGEEIMLSGFADSYLPSFPSPAEKARVLDIARRVQATHLLGQTAPAMSQGQLRLVLLARALCASPRLLLLDEAFDGLDGQARSVLFRVAEQAVSEGVSLICTAHRAEDLPPAITHMLHLEQGRMVSSGPRPPARHAEAAPVAPMLPRAVGVARRRREAPVLELPKVDGDVDRARVLHNISWRVRPGEHWRIGGVNGSGKSTLFRALIGLERAAAGGSLRWFGKSRLPLRELQRRVGYLSDSLHASYTYDDLTGLELVYSGFDGSIGLYRDITPEERDAALRWVSLLALEEHADVPLRRLSSGTARRFFLARALAANPRVLLLDEPCSGMDAVSRALFLTTLSAAMRQGVQCLCASHHDDDLPDGVAYELTLEQGAVAYAGERRS